MATCAPTSELLAILKATLERDRQGLWRRVACRLPAAAAAAFLWKLCARFSTSSCICRCFEAKSLLCNAETAMRACAAFILLLPATATAFVAVQRRQQVVIITSPTSSLKSSPIDDFFANIFGNDDKKKNDDSVKNINDGDEEINLSSFQKELSKRQQQQNIMVDSEETASVMSISDADDNTDTEEEEEFDGYAMGMP